ncbi:MAG: DNA polymerase I [Eubacteriaceae bacterium]|nr:DNA polymerase I [Eubacteriaceae bacterium]
MINRIVIIDGNSLINRAYYAMQRPMITKEGIYTQGIYGFLNMLNKIQDDYSPDYMTVAWDRKAPTFRHEEYKEYKAGRKKMPLELAMELPIMKEILTAMKIPNLEIDGFEADDIIGTVARLAEEAGMEPLIITGDKDALQLATDKTHVLITRKGITDFDLYDREKMIERYQLTPEQFIDLKGLMGDQSDNIPGIPGVGEKTGIKLLTQFGSVANMLANTDQIANVRLRQKVEDNAQLAAMSRRLATINRYVPLDINLDDFKVETPDYQKLVDLYVKLEFNSFLKKLNPVSLQEALGNSEDEEIQVEEHYIESIEQLEQLSSIDAGAAAVIKTFSDDNHVQVPALTGVALLSGSNYFYIKVSESEMEEKLIGILNEKQLSYIGHDLIKDYYVLMRKGQNVFNTAFDTAVAGYVLDPSKSKYDLKILAFELLHSEFPDVDEFIENNGQMDLLGSNDRKYCDFGLEYCKTVMKIRKLQEEKLKKEELEVILKEVELPLIEVLASMEAEGFRVDGAVLDELGDMLKSEIKTLENNIFALSGKEFNINSPMQLGNILFEDLGLPSGKKTKRGYSTGADVLEKLRDKHPIVDMVLQYRTLTKLNSTYVEGLKPLIGKDGRIRAHFQQTVTATGRISCTEPNLQNIPIRQELGRQLRRAFVCDNNQVLVGADYSQIELRVLAHMSGDENLISAFNNGDDIHRNTASRVFNIPYDEVTSLDRSRAKAVNFGVIYGMSGFGLSENLKITRKEAEKYIADYFSKHTAVKEFMDGEIAFCKENGYTKTIMGRKRYIHEINSSNFMTRNLGERLAMNSPIQGSAADIIKIAMIKVYEELKKDNYKSKLILQVHDELIIKTYRDEEEKVKELLIRNMEEAMQMKVNLESDLNEGETWFDLK